MSLSGTFQSLSRDSGRLNPMQGASAAVPPNRVSIPQSGFGAFELPCRSMRISFSAVSIPQSGFGAFEPSDRQRRFRQRLQAFQSLSRDSGRLNVLPVIRVLRNVLQFQSLSRDSGRLNLGLQPLVGWNGVQFQSLSRDSGRLNSGWACRWKRMIPRFNPSVGIRGV